MWVALAIFFILFWEIIRPKTKLAKLYSEPDTANITCIIPTIHPHSFQLVSLLRQLEKNGIPYCVVSPSKRPKNIPVHNYLHVENIQKKANKKHLLIAAWEHINTPWYLQLDDDVVLPPYYIRVLQRIQKADLNICPVHFLETRWWHWFNTIEHLGLMLTALHAQQKLTPTSCSGAHLLYSKKLTKLTLQHRDWFLRYPSGDDMDLLYLAKKNGYHIASQAHPDFWVATYPQETLPQMLRQRARWITKPRSGAFPAAWVFGMYNVLFYLLLVPVFILHHGVYAVLLCAAKAFLDWITIHQNSGVKKLRISGIKVLLFQGLYPLYLGILLILGITRSHSKW